MGLLRHAYGVKIRARLDVPSTKHGASVLMLPPAAVLNTRLVQQELVSRPAFLAALAHLLPPHWLHASGQHAELLRVVPSMPSRPRPKQVKTAHHHDGNKQSTNNRAGNEGASSVLSRRHVRRIKNNSILNMMTIIVNTQNCYNDDIYSPRTR